MSIFNEYIQHIPISEFITKYQETPSTPKYKTFCLIDSSLDTPFTKLNSIKFDFFAKSTCFFSLDTENLNDIFHLIERHQHLDLNLIFINRSSKFIKKFHQALLLIDQKLNYSVFDECLSLENRNYSLQHLIDADKKSFFNLAFLGQQSHLSDYNAVEEIKECNVILHRLAEIKNNSEPYISTLRDTEAASLFLSVLKSSELLSTSGDISSSGLLVEDLAQIAYNLGNSAKCRILNIQLNHEQENILEKQCEIALQLLWYHLDGITKMNDPLPSDLQNFQEYTVEECLGNANLRFLKSTQSGKWWVEIPFEVKDAFKKHRFYPCSYRNYLAASKGELPDELIEIIERFEIARME